jgi:type I restriction enzyme S subunit
MIWPNAPLGRLAQMVGGGTPSKKNEAFWTGGDIPWVSPKDMGNREVWDAEDHITEAAVEGSATQIVPEGSVLVVVRSGILVRRVPIALARVPVSLNQDMKALLPGGPLLPDYLAYALEAKAEQILASCVKRGATVHSIDIGTLNNLRFGIPGPSEQRRIVGILDQAGALQKLRSEADAKAKRILPALFIELFGDPTKNPKGWPTRRIGDLFNIFGGGTPSKTVSEYWTGDIPWVSPKDMKCDVVIDSEDHITEVAIENSATRLVKKDSVLVVYRSGILAHSFPVAIAGTDLTINQDLKAMSSKGQVANEYLYGLLSSRPQLGLSCVKKGATVHNVDGSRFLGLKIPQPPKELIDAFARELDIYLNQKSSRQKTAESIDHLFNILLRLAFTGDLTASWREAHMKELLKEMEQQAKLLEGQQ